MGLFKQEVAGRKGQNSEELEVQKPSEGRANIKNTAGNIKNISDVLTAVDKFQDSALGKLVFNEFLGDVLPKERREKKSKLETCLKSLKDFVIPVIITVTGCYIAICGFKAALGMWLI